MYWYWKALNSNHTQNMKCLLHDDGGPCYEIIDIPATLSEATEDCAFRGGTLALIDNQKTHNFLRSLIYRNSQ